MDHINDNKTLEKGVLKPLIVDAFKMMAHSVASNSKTRREKIRNAVLPKFRNMIQKSKPSATLLLGDKIKEEVKALNEKSTAVTQSAGSSKQGFFTEKRGCSSIQQTEGHPLQEQQWKAKEMATGPSQETARGKDISKIKVSANSTIIIKNTLHNFQAGKTKLHFNNWKKITNDKWVLQTICGYHVELMQTPCQRTIPKPLKFEKI